MRCPHCNGLIWIDDDELKCRNCARVLGYIDKRTATYSAGQEHYTVIGPQQWAIMLGLRDDGHQWHNIAKETGFTIPEINEYAQCVGHYDYPAHPVKPWIDTRV